MASSLIEKDKQLEEMRALNKAAQESAIRDTYDAIMSTTTKSVTGPLRLRSGNVLGNEGEELRIRVGKLPKGRLELVHIPVVDNFMDPIDHVRHLFFPYIVVSDQQDNHLYGAWLPTSLFDQLDERAGIDKSGQIDWPIRYAGAIDYIQGQQR